MFRRFDRQTPCHCEVTVQGTKGRVSTNSFHVNRHYLSLLSLTYTMSFYVEQYTYVSAETCEVNVGNYSVSGTVISYGSFTHVVGYGGTPGAIGAPGAPCPDGTGGGGGGGGGGGRWGYNGAAGNPGADGGCPCNP